MTENIDLVKLGQELMAAAHEKSTVGIVIAIVCGLLTLFFGYKLLKLWIGVAGFFIGLILGGGVAALLKVPATGIIISALVVAVLLACAAFFFYKAGVFLFAGITGFSLVTNLILGFNSNQKAWWIAAIGIAVGLIVGILAIKFVRPVIIISTSFSAASSLAFTICPLMGLTNFWLMAVVCVIMAVLGFVFQTRSTEPTGKYVD